MKILKFVNKYYWFLVAGASLVAMVASSRYAQAELTRQFDGKEHILYSAPAVSAAAANNVSDTFPAAPFKQGTFQFIWAGHSGGDTSTFALQSSLDGSNWDTISSTSITSSGTTGSSSLDIASLPGAYIRMKVTAASTTGSTITPYFIGKR